ncbi:MAG: phosphatidate cytidylyltransferase [Flavobacteriaceae bacterium]|jgi:phosphatidate cytidylyltransferase|nr:phosphatidate cytidylyltransferase [Flavobacteriaceae bacterium]MBT3753511.1 phosphatidate cytidylyltransferase [Flavobacteriaceae bacterium]MBT3794135.1 phosphatidate cytidylyltransferase [Flavobacteriaceae bacterium]MBT4062542.1 phosphatidate cytidylyltransferase [Flavobacteriaceae bacterium]MBT5011717.1 phosphatidate cytidylyltransferase [Flavobacteriaceae bacterium]
MKEFYTRSLTAIAYAAVLLFSLFYNQYLFYFVGFICSLILVFEFIKLITDYNHKFLSIDSGKSNLILYLTFPLYIFLFLLSKNSTFQLVFLLIIILTNIILGFSLLKKKLFSFSILKNRFIGHFYLVGSLVIFFTMSNVTNSHNPLIVFSFLMLIWVSDSAAYVFGVNFGKRPLFKSVSPKKSVEGFFGGIIFSIILSLFFHKYLNLDFTIIQWLIIGLLTSSLGALGDLVQSQFKREAGVKDSGKFLPGHGGLYDRMDSIIFAAPFIYLTIKIFIYVS